MNAVSGSILLAVDGSQHSQAAVELVHDLPLPPQTNLTVLSVVYRRDASAQLQPVLEKVVAQAQARLEEKGLNMAAEIVQGHPAEVIAGYADAHSCGLIVVGAVGLRATLGILLGGVAQQVVEHASCPVLVVRAPYSGLKRAMVVTDGSSCSQLAVNYLGRFPLPADTRVEVMHVLAPPITVDRIAAAWPVGAGMLIYPTDDDMVAQMAEWQIREEQAGREILSSASAVLERAGRAASVQMPRGDAATEILRHAREKQVDLLVAGSRGLSQVRGWLMGSVSRKLVYHASSSVLIVKGSPPGLDRC